MLERSRELLFALVAIVFITMVYFLMLALTRGIPAASSLYGHGMGILGFVLMLMTEIVVYPAQALEECPPGENGALARVPYLHRHRRPLPGAAAHLVEIQWAGRRGDAADRW